MQRKHNTNRGKRNQLGVVCKLKAIATVDTDSICWVDFYSEHGMKKWTSGIFAPFFSCHQNSLAPLDVRGPSFFCSKWVRPCHMPIVKIMENNYAAGTTKKFPINPMNPVAQCWSETLLQGRKCLCIISRRRGISPALQSILSAAFASLGNWQWL